MNDDRKLDSFNNIYFVGAGGIGMAALVRFFLSKGKHVAGYDRTRTVLTDEISTEGAEISYSDSMDAVPERFRNPADTLIVYTPAIPADNVPLSFFRKGGFTVYKRSQVLGMITRGSRSLCFSGTHGKTTTSSMAAHIMHEAAGGCNAFLGGILRNYNSNLLLSETSSYTVIEADEYDRSFHTLTPYIAVVTATDPDHLDIYGTEEAYLESFAHFTELIRPDGCLLVHTGLKLKPRPSVGVKVYTYSRDEGDFHADNVRHGNGSIVFDFIGPDGLHIPDISLGVPVEVNIENAVAALAACMLTLEVDPVKAAEAIGSFMGPERRFQFIVKPENQAGAVLIDDYAHHPDELRQSIASVKALYPDRKLTVAFQPHLFTRTRDFAPEFAQALSLADEVILLDIYPARELPLPGVTSQIIYDALTVPAHHQCSLGQLCDIVSELKPELMLTAGAGDISTTIPQLKEIFEARNITLTNG